jgi:ABC-type nitrate/sulfonate/bicarbonate transport system substrate-binding protein
MHVIFASDEAIQKRPGDLRKFLAGWFDTIRYMRTHKAEAVRIASQVGDVSPQIEARVYDAVMPMFSDTGRFDPKALAVLARSFVELKLLRRKPDMSKLYTEKFLPAIVPK